MTSDDPIHYRETGHPVVQSFEPGEDWFWDYSAQSAASGPSLAPATSRPDDQPVTGPAGAVPSDWRAKLNR